MPYNLVPLSKQETSRPTFLPYIQDTNCRSINTRKFTEIASYVEIHKPDLSCLTETWRDTNEQQTIKLDGYDSHFSNRKGRVGGGVCILSSSHLNATLLCTYITRTVSAAWILIQVKTHRPVIIGCIYHPPNSDQGSTLEYLESTVAKLTSKYPTANYVITGDFNKLPVDELCSQFGFRDLVNFTTRADAKLDLVLTDEEEYTEALKLAPIAQNDHCCILVEGKLCQKSKYTKVKRRLITPERKQDLLANLAATDWNEVICAPSVHSKVNIYHQKITELLDRHCPERVVKVRSDRPPWITSSIIKLITARDEAFRRGCLSYKFLRSLVQKAVRASKRRYINDKLNSDQNSKAWWDTVKQITNNKSTKPIAEYTVIDGERLSNEQLSTNLNDSYKSVGGDAVYIDSSTEQSQRAALDPVSIGEVKTLLNQLDITKATSHEDYPTWLSKEGKEDICVPEHDIINSMLNSGQYPDFHKRAQIKPLP